ncbi:MAG: OmpA family protein [Bacteroidales bacterium]|jgi:outer membrane protein OmpA-like peptidoglycan-associated protein|nr:OmpA family protein [Bacteroidales bacterium]
MFKIGLPLFAFILLYINCLYSQELDTINLYFEIDKYDITNQHRMILEDLIGKKDAIDIEVYGYTDFLGDAEYNISLSEKRCNNVKDYLISQGVESKKIAIWNGKGIHSESSLKNRTDMDDPGIKEHRKVEIIYGKFEPVFKEIINEEVEIPIFQSFIDENLVVGNNIVLEDILFYGNSSNFRPESMPALNYLVKVMKNNPSLKIEIQGYICCEKGNKEGFDEVYKEYNLSSNRARSVYHYLIANGVEENRMTFKGFGASKKRYPKERNEEEKAKNRRVEILILEK